jgi:secreted protein with Ig-like and vWFA domain
MITFAFPRALLLLLLLPVVVALGLRRVRRLPGWRGPAVLFLRLLVLGLLVAAVADPAWRVGTRRQALSVVFLVDASDSVGASGRQAGMTWAERASAAAGPQDMAGMVLFGAAPQLAVPLAHYRTLPDPATGAAGATDIGAAIRLGTALLAPDTPGRLVLLSDGRDTTSALSDAVALAMNRHIPVDTVAIVPPARRDVAVSALDAPTNARVGDQVPVRITLASSVATNATLTITIDGQQVQQPVRLPAGETVLTTRERLTTQGLHAVSVRINAPGDIVPQNNSRDAVTVAGPPGRVLLVGTGRGPAVLSKALAQDRLDVRTISPSALPTDAAKYAGDDAVVLDNVPATSLSDAQQHALGDAVSAGGLGLLVVGGATAYGAGGYVRTPLEQALPVRSKSTLRPVRAPVSLMLVIDESGSMDEDVNGVAKLDMVKVAAASAVDQLQDGDAVGVLAFSDTNQVIVPFHVVHGSADKARMRREIAGIASQGGTTIYPALQEATRDVVRVPTPNRHIVLLTDGQGEEAPFDTLIRQMRRNHITLSTIGVGQDVQRDELHHWATLGGGLFHYVADPHAIPRIVVSETHYRALGQAVEGTIHLGAATPSPLLRGLAGHSLPSIDGYALTQAKSTAQVAVRTPRGDPVLASWQNGLGRVAAWTSDDGTGGWAPGWSTTRLPAFWTDTVRWVLRGYMPPPGTPVLTTHDGALQVSVALQTADGHFDDAASPVVRLIGPDGAAQPIALALVAPGTYQAERPLGGPGIYSATAGDTGSDPSAIGALAVPYSTEYAAGGADTTALLQIATATGGRTLSRPADAFAHGRLPLIPVWRPLWSILLLIALLLFPLDVVLRLSAMTGAGYRRHASSPLAR